MAKIKKTFREIKENRKTQEAKAEIAIERNRSKFLTIRGKEVSEDIRKTKNKEASRANFNKKINKLASTVVTSRKIMKTGQMQVHIQDKEIPEVLHDEQRFFKGEFNKDKRKLFLE